MACVLANSCEDWRLWLAGFAFFLNKLADLILELGDVLVSMQRYNSIVVVSCGDKHCRVVLLSDVVKGRVLDQEVVIALLITAAIL